MGYLLLGFERILVIEPHKRVYEILASNVAYLNRVLREFDKLVGRPREVRIKAVNCAAGVSSERSVFYEYEQSSLSSLFVSRGEGWSFESMGGRVAGGSGREDALSRSASVVDVETLDQIVSGIDETWSASQFNFLRLNVQGSELLVLRGAGEVLRKMDAMLVEVSNIERYAGAPLARDVDAFLGTAGFCAMWGHSYFGDTVSDLLYLRNEKSESSIAKVG